MRNPKRIDIITQKLNKLWHYYPDFRFWQLLSVLEISEDPFYWEETKWEQVIDEAIRKIEEKNNN